LLAPGSTPIAESEKPVSIGRALEIMMGLLEPSGRTGDQVAYLLLEAAVEPSGATIEALAKHKVEIIKLVRQRTLP
jgi:hypothetical protein